MADNIKIEPHITPLVQWVVAKVKACYLWPRGLW